MVDRPQRFVVEIETDPMTLKIALEGVAGGSVDSLGLRIGRAEQCRALPAQRLHELGRQLFRRARRRARRRRGRSNGCSSGHAMTALVSQAGRAPRCSGFLRHDRFQSRLRFAFAEGPLSLDVETLIDGVPSAATASKQSRWSCCRVSMSRRRLRDWARRVAAASPLPPRLPGAAHRRLVLLVQPLRLDQRSRSSSSTWPRRRSSATPPGAVRHLPDRRRLHARDGRLARGQAAVSARHEAAARRHPGQAASRPGLWIAPFMVGNRSRLFAEHPDWVVTRSRDRRAARADDVLRRVPLAQAQRGILRPRHHPSRRPKPTSARSSAPGRRTGAAATSRPTSCISAAIYGPRRGALASRRACRASRSGCGWRG